jgi:prepilin-type N-terminal cleavage/methylation domain-containing protein
MCALGPAAAARNGFTLVEVLVALVILAVGLLGLGALGSAVARSLGTADRDTRAAAIASAFLEDALDRLLDNEIPASCHEQELPDGALLTRTVRLGATPAGPHHVEVIVTPAPHGTAPRPFTVRTHVLARATPGPPASEQC